MQILDEESGVYYIISGAAAKLRDTYIGSNTVFAVSRLGFMTFLLLREGSGLPGHGIRLRSHLFVPF